MNNFLRGALAAPVLRKSALFVAVFLLLVGALGFIVLPPLVKSLLADRLAQALHRPVRVDSVSINPYALSLEVIGLSIQEPGGGSKVAGFDRLYVNVEASSLFRGGAVVSELKLDGPVLHVVRLADGHLNFSDLIDEVANRPSANDPTPLFSLNNIQISGGAVDFDDRLLGEKHALTDLQIALPFISSLPTATEIFVVPAFSAVIDGAPFVIQGRSKPFAATQESEISFTLRSVQLGSYLAYLPVRLPVSSVAATMDGEITLHFQRHDRGPAAVVVAGQLVLSDVAVKDGAGDSLLSFRRLEVVADHLDPVGAKYALQRVTLDAPEIHARVDRQGGVNWLEFFRRQGGTSGTEGAQSAPVEWYVGKARIDGGALRWRDESHGQAFTAALDHLTLELSDLDSRGVTPAHFAVAWHLEAGEWIRDADVAIKGGRLDLARREVVIDEVSSRGQFLLRRTAEGGIDFVPPPQLKAVAASQKDTGVPWKINIAQYQVQDLAVRFEDRAVSPAISQTLTGGVIEVGNLTTEPGRTTTVRARGLLNRKGEVAVEGGVRLQPLSLDLKVAGKELELLPLQPYFTERLNVEVTRGHVAVDGRLQLRPPSLPAGGALSGGFVGQVTVGDFAATDKLNAADFLKWRSLFLGRIDLRLQPTSLAIEEVALTDFYSRLIVSREGRLNLLQIVRPSGPEKAAVTPEGEGKAVASADGRAATTIDGKGSTDLPIKIGRITLQGGDIRFTDNFVKPNYSANLKKIGGSVSGLSSQVDSVASLDLRGSYDNVAPLAVKAKLNPFAKSPFLDLEADVKGIEMTSFSPYSGKYAGYAIEKGKLSLFVKYRIENNQLAAENRVFLDQLTFGEPVASPEATKLPVTLAVALLKNRNGEIDINLPIAGSLDDPQFSVGGLLLKVVVNLLVKAVTSPFALLGAVFSGGEELSAVNFDAGSAIVTQTAQQRLEKLAQALQDRPSLKLEIEGRADPERDLEGLKQERMRAKVRAVKRGEMTKQGLESDSSDTVQVSAEEYPALLARVYRDERFPKPRNFIGMVKGLPVEEMEKLIVAHTAVDEDDLRDLADRRAKATRDALLARGVGAERLFLLPAQIGQAERKANSADNAKEGQVVFALK